MKNILVIIVVFALFFLGCSKDKFQTKPQLTIKSINNNSFNIGEVIKIDVEFTDAEGDVQDTLWIQRKSKVCDGAIGIIEFSKHAIPNFTTTSNQKGIFEIKYIYGRVNDVIPTINGCATKSDTSFFRFWMKDKAGNRSDTVATSNITLVK